MPLGIVSDSEFEQDSINSGAVPTEPVKEGIVEDINSPGRKEDQSNIPEEVRALISDTHLESGFSVASALARGLGISDSSVSAYANEATSTASYNKPNAPLHNFLTGRKQRIAKKAAKALNAALDEFTPERIQAQKLTDIAIIAKTMSGIVKDMEPEPEKNSNPNAFQVNGPSIIMMAPPLIPETKLESMRVDL